MGNYVGLWHGMFGSGLLLWIIICNTSYQVVCQVVRCYVVC